MAELDYSIEARNILNKFYGVENIVYVEGQDDIAFWEHLFDKLSGIKIKAEEAGGKDKLQARIEEIREGSANYFVAMDSDFDWLHDVESHTQIFSTFGYSMENTIISDSSLQRLISRVAKVSKHQVEKDKCQEWLSNLETEVHTLVLADAINRQQSLGLTVISDNCDRFLASKNSCKLSSKKITSHLGALSINIDDEFKDAFEGKMDARGLSVVDVLRGHFLISAAFRFVKDYLAELRTVISISREMLFGSLMLAFEASFDENHKHYEYYRSIFSQN